MAPSCAFASARRRRRPGKVGDVAPTARRTRHGLGGRRPHAMNRSLDAPHRRPRPRNAAAWCGVVLASLALVACADLTPPPAAGDAPPSLTLLGAFVPGAVWDELDGLEELEGALGRRFDLAHWFTSWDHAYDPVPVDAVLGSGRVPLITWQPHNQDVRDIAAGMYDDYLRTWAHGIRGAGGVVYLRPFPEMNGDWVPWNGDPEGLVRRVAPPDRASSHARARSTSAGSGAPTSPTNRGPKANRLERYYPGADQVDVLALSGYNWGGTRPHIGWRVLRGDRRSGVPPPRRARAATRLGRRDRVVRGRRRQGDVDPRAVRRRIASPASKPWSGSTSARRRTGAWRARRRRWRAFREAARTLDDPLSEGRGGAVGASARTGPGPAVVRGCAVVAVQPRQDAARRTRGRRPRGPARARPRVGRPLDVESVRRDLVDDGQQRALGRRDRGGRPVGRRRRRPPAPSVIGATRSNASTIGRWRSLTRPSTTPWVGLT